MAIRSPAKILNLWNRAVKKHEEGKKPADLPKKGQEQKGKVKKGLTNLKIKAAHGLSDAGAREKFVALRDRVAVVMTKYCRYLKAAKDEDKAVLPRFLKSVKQLTVVVQQLEPGSLDESEDEVGLDALDAVDVAALDETLSQPDTQADVDLDDEPEEVPPAPAVDEGAAFTARLKALLPRVLQAQKANPALALDLKLAVSEAQVFSRKQDFAQANALLDKAEGLMKSAPAAPAAPSADGTAAFTARLKALLPRALEAQKANPAIATDVKLGVSEAQVFARKQDFAQANALLDKVEGLLGRGPAEAAPAASAPTAEAARKDLIAALQAWQAASASVDGQITQLQAALKKTGKTDLVEIANFGLNGVTGNHKVKLMAVLRDVGGNKGDAQKQAVLKGLPILAGFQNHLASDNKVAACDANPFGVTVTIRSTLGSALTQLGRAFESVHNV
jgi:hypothetical protein